MKRIGKRNMGASLALAAMIAALSTREAPAQARPWSVSFDVGTRAALTGLEPINDESRRWSMPITGGITVRS